MTKDVLLLSLIAYLPVSRAVLFVRNRTNRGVADYAAVDSQNAINILATLLMLGLIVLPRARRSNNLIVRGPTQWLLVYYVLCVLSCLWGTNPLYTVYRAAELIILLVFMAYILDMIGDPHDAIIYLCRFCAVTAFLPYLAGVLRYGGIIQHTNAYSTAGAFGTILALASVRSGAVTFLEVRYSLLACLFSVLLGTSAASNLSLIVGLVLVWSFSRQPGSSRLRLLAAVIVLSLTATAAFEIMMPYLFPGKDLQDITSLHGRVGLWRLCLQAGRQQAMLGGSFAVGERSIDLWGSGVTNSAHNSLVSVFINTGGVGLGFFVLAWWALLRQAYWCHLQGSPYAYPVIAAVVVGLVNSMSYPLVGSSWKYVTTPFLGIVAYVSVFLAPMYYARGDEDALLDCAYS